MFFFFVDMACSRTSDKSAEKVSMHEAEINLQKSSAFFVSISSK